MTSKISIALAVYNGERHLPEFLNSLMTQTRLPDELVVSDDASTDNTINILKQFSAKAPFPVQIHANPKNRGVTKNFESAISHCTGDIIFLADHDDIWLPDKIRATGALLANNPSAGLAFCNAQMANDSLTPLGYTIWEALNFSKNKQKKACNGNALEVFLQYSMIAGMTMAFRMPLRDIALPFPELPTCHDTCLLLIAAATSEIDFTPKPLAIHRVHATNNSGISRKNLYQQFLRAKNQIKTNWTTYQHNLHQAVLGRLNQKKAFLTVKPGAEVLLRQKINHMQCRVNMPQNFFKRILIVAKELKKGNYRRFSYGWKSALQDLLLRKF